MTANRRDPGDGVIIIGVDFGTTYTGVAYAHTLTPYTIKVIQNWPSHAGGYEPSGKIPTRLRYLDDDHFEWGGLVAPNSDDVMEYFKLALDPEHTNKLQNGSRLLRGNLLGQDIEKIVTDYLTGICEYVKGFLRNIYSDSIEATSSFQYVLTVPAIWSDLAKQKTVDAFAKAMGVTDKSSIYPITEPEAAATCILQQMPAHDLKSGDCFIVVDAGGGTVDLISYTVKDLYPSLSVSEAATGSGGACGAAFLNERFRNWVVQTLGQEDEYDNTILRSILRQWETRTKRTFAMADLPGERYEFAVHGLENNKDLKIKASRWSVTAPEVLRVFEGVVLQVLKLVTDQRAATNVNIKAIFLVGGFSQSTYLQERLQAHVGDIQVLRPNNAWTAVVEGAVMRGLARVVPEQRQNIKIVDRKARKHYGFELMFPFNHIRHAAIAHKKQYNYYNGQWEIQAIQWFIKKGDPVTESQPYSKQIMVTSRVTWGPPKLVMVNVYSDETSETPPVAKDGNVKPLCNIEANLSTIPEAQLLQEKGIDGQMYYVVHCEIEIAYDAASAAYTLIHNGQRHNTVTAELI